MRGDGGDRDVRRGEREDPRLPGEPARGGVGGLAADGRTADVSGEAPTPPRPDPADEDATAAAVAGDTPGDVSRPAAGAPTPDNARPRRASS